MKFIARVDPKGRVTLPKEVREELGIKPGDLVVLSLEEGRVEIKPLGSAADKYYGVYNVKEWPEDLDEFLEGVVKEWREKRDT